MSPAAPTLAPFDPRSAAYLRDPQAALLPLLDEAPVLYHEALDKYYVLAYDDVRAVVSDGETYSSHAYRRLPDLKADLDQELRFVPSQTIRGIVAQRATWSA